MSAQRRITSRKVQKLQRAGLISSKIDPNSKPSKQTLAKLYKYRSVISGKEAAVRLDTAKSAKEFRDRIGQGGAGRVVIIPREKGEKFKVKDGQIVSTRTQYGQKIEKTIGDKFSAPRPGEKVYYTLPSRKRGLGSLKRRTFASFDEMLFYLTTYEINFEDIEDYIEVERTKPGSTLDKRVRSEYLTARNKLRKKRKKKRAKKAR
jgi:hypothetical protein